MAGGNKKKKSKETLIDEVKEVAEPRVVTEDIKKVVNPKLSANEYAICYQKDKQIAKILPVLDKKYKRDQTKQEWDFAFKALKCKPSNVSWKDHVKNLKRGNN